MEESTLIIFLFAFLFWQCKKDASTGPINISGQVVDKNLNTPIAVAEVDLIERDGGMFGGGSSQTLQRLYADSNGRFTFSNITINSAKTYTVLGYKSLYFNDGNNTVDVNTNQPNNIIVAMQPMAWLKLHVKDTAPFDNHDQINFGTPGGIGGFYVGMNIDTISLNTENGNTKIDLYYFTLKNKDTTRFHYQIYCPAFDTTIYQLYY